MIDSFDYKEPSCVLCDGKNFYNPKKDDPIGTIPVSRIIEKVDTLFDRNDLYEVGRLLEYWKSEAISLKDLRGELSVTDELVGFYRKTNDKSKALNAVEDCLRLIQTLEIADTVSAGTIYLNCATTLKAFDNAESAIPLYDKTFALYSKNLPSNDEKFAGFYNNKALALVDLSRFDEAFDCYFKAIKIGLENGKDKLNVAVTYVNMAHAYETAKLGKDKITDCLFSAYEILTDDNVNKNGYYAFVLSKCAPSFRYFAFDKIANDFDLEVKKIYEGN